MVVKLLITGKKKIQGTITISYSFQNDKITINENITPPKNVKEFGHCGKFKAIHMASSGYYSKQLKFNQQSSKFIEYI
jgi:hypothetical protein